MKKPPASLRNWTEKPVFDRIQKLFTVALDMVLPRHCLECDHIFFKPEARGPALLQHDVQMAFDDLLGGFLCPSCRQTFAAIQSPLCLCCGLPFTSPHGPDHLCGDCRELPFRFHQARSAGRYQHVLRTLVHRFKYQGCIQLAEPLGRLLWLVFLTHWDPGQVDAVVPIPLHPKRLRQRGFNQARQLIRQWPKLAASRGIAWNSDKSPSSLLLRKRFTAPQTGLDRHQRAANVKGAFVIAKPEAVAGRRLLIVDDVLTTGATVQACTRLLKQAGAARVDVLTLARAV